MNTKQKISMLTLGAIIVAASYWTGYVHGSSNLTPNEMIISVALPAILIWTLTKLTFGFFFQGDPSRPGGGSQPPSEPAGVPMPRPPGAPPVIHCRQAV